MRHAQLLLLRPGRADENLEEGLCHFAAGTASCTFEGALAPDEALQMDTAVTVNEAPGALTNTATVSGGGAPEASTSEENHIGPTPPAFGAQAFSTFMSGPAGEQDTQAGGHPYEMTTVIDLNSEFKYPNNGTTNDLAKSVQDVKDIVIDLPLGFAASTLAAPECTLAEFSSFKQGSEGCPPDTRVGYIRTEPETLSDIRSNIFNLVPEKGIAGEFGFQEENNTYILYGTVAPSPAGYVLRVTSHDIPQVDINHIVTTFFGDPAEKAGSGNPQIPFFTNPAACSGGPLVTTVHVDSWQHPGSYNADGTPNFNDSKWVSAQSLSLPVNGCNALLFTPELEAQPTTHQADSPTGLEFALKLAQSEVAESAATPALRDATVTFPEGMTVDPSSGSGLAACSIAQIGWLGGTPFNFSPDPPSCPEASKIGSLELETPLIPGVLHGEIYLAAQDENPFASVFATYVVVHDPTTGVLIKLAGELRADPHTGRLTAFFPENAQLPFSDLKLHFFGGPRAELATPQACGTFTSTSVLEPWSAPDSGPNATPFDNFVITEGCVSGFNPSFAAGSTNLQAGAFTTFVASFSRQDTDEDMGGLSVTLPPGLSARVGGVPQCPEAQIQAARAGTGECPQESEVGTVTAFAGPGPNPLFVTGKAYWTGPYNGGPFGSSSSSQQSPGRFTWGTWWCASRSGSTR